jgi:biotin carboxylase
VATLLFLGASISQMPAIAHARAAGHHIVAVDGDPDAVGFALADVRVDVDFTHIEAVIAAGAVHEVDGVLAISSDRAVAPAAAVAEALGLPGIGLDVARAMTDKAAMRARLAHAGVPQPRGTVVTAASDLDAALEGLPLPAVLKPVDSGGQRGVFRIDGRDELERRLPESLAHSVTSRALLEEFVTGPELNGIVVVRDAVPMLVTLSDRLRPDGPGFGVGWAHLFPSALDGDVLERARAVAFEAIRALGLRDGIAFPQLIAADDGARLIEIAARIPAGQMADLVRFGAGVELYDVAIAQALGRPVPDALLARSRTRPLAIRFLTAQPGVLPLGTVVSVGQLDVVRRSHGVLAAGVYFEPGATITPVQVDADRRGYVIATAGTPQAALALADAAARKLVVRTLRPVAVPGTRRLVLSAAAGVAAVATSAAVFASSGAARPRLLSDVVRSGAGRVQVRYDFNEPVRAELLVRGRPATTLSTWRRQGELSWRLRGRRLGPIAIEGIDRSGRRAVFNVLNRVRAAVPVRHRGAA